jgi:predicted RecB family nuclease
LCQLDRIGKAISKTLYDAGIQTLQQLGSTDARRIEHLLGRNAPFGNEIKDSIHIQIPLLFLNVASNPGEISIEFGLVNQSYSVTSVKFAHLLVLEYGKGDANLLQYRKIE